MSNGKDIAYYRRRPYHREVELIEEDGERYFVARIAELPWINIDGESRYAALLRLDEVFDDCVQSMLDQGDEIPEPLQWPYNTGYEPRPGSLFAGASATATQLENLPAFTRIAPPENVGVG